MSQISPIKIPSGFSLQRQPAPLDTAAPNTRIRRQPNLLKFDPDFAYQPVQQPRGMKRNIHYSTLFV